MPKTNTSLLTILNLPARGHGGKHFDRRSFTRSLREYGPVSEPRPMFPGCHTGVIDSRSGEGNCGRHGGSATCQVCRRELQLVAMATIPEMLATENDGVWLVTLIRKEWSRPLESLDTWSLRNAKRYAYDLLRELPGARVFGAFDISLEVNSKGTKANWAPHLHMLVSGVQFDQLRNALGYQRSTRFLKRPIQIKEVHDLLKAVAYVAKAPGVRRARFVLPERTVDGRKKFGARKTQLKAAERELLNEAWHMHKQSDLLLLHGIRFPRFLRVHSNPRGKA